MTPFTTFLYFGISLYALLPNLLFGWFKRTSKMWIVVATAFMLVVQYLFPQNISTQSATWVLWLVLAYAGLEYATASLFLLIRKRRASRAAFYTALGFSLLPLLAARLVPFAFPAYGLFFAGLSYTTFRSLDVIFGIQDDLIHALPIFQYLSFLLFFPAISSGPIDRYLRFQADWTHQRSGTEIIQDLDSGIHHIFTGFLYKFILAALIKQYWLDIVAPGTDFSSIVHYMYAYSFYLFFDFAGYSAFAVGFSHFFGIHTPENFRLPFLARNVRDFWNRWHISLSEWFHDHVYSRFVFSAIQGNWFKNKFIASYLGFLLSMGLMGLWHGTAWHYILYGLYHALLLILSDALGRLNKTHKWWNARTWHWQLITTFFTFQFVCFGLLIFSGRLF